MASKFIAGTRQFQTDLLFVGGPLNFSTRWSRSSRTCCLSSTTIEISRFSVCTMKAFVWMTCFTTLGLLQKTYTENSHCTESNPLRTFELNSTFVKQKIYDRNHSKYHYYAFYLTRKVRTYLQLHNIKWKV